MIGHALALAPRSARLGWDRWIAAGLAVGSACFVIGPFPGFVQLVGQGADGVVFFAGSVFFTLAAALELRETTLRLHRRFADASWWSAAVQFAGTLLFNVSTFDAMQTGLSTHEQNRLVWAPDLFGSGCFLASGALAYAVTTGPHLLPTRMLPRSATTPGGWPPSTSRVRVLRHLGGGVLRGPVDVVRPRARARELVHCARRPLTLSHTLASTLADDIAQACHVLAQKGGLHEHDRKRAKVGTGY